MQTPTDTPSYKNSDGDDVSVRVPSQKQSTLSDILVSTKVLMVMVLMSIGGPSALLQCFTPRRIFRAPVKISYFACLPLSQGCRHCGPQRRAASTPFIGAARTEGPTLAGLAHLTEADRG
jgi:hypothetical protein